MTLVVFLAIGSTTRSQTAPTSSGAKVNFCRLTETPRQFHNQIIRVKAILVMNHTPRVDGGDPFLYDVACAENNPYVVVQFSPNFKWNAGYTKLLRTQNIQTNSETHGLWSRWWGNFNLPVNANMGILIGQIHNLLFIESKLLLVSLDERFGQRASTNRSGPNKSGMKVEVKQRDLLNRQSIGAAKSLREVVGPEN